MYIKVLLTNLINEPHTVFAGVCIFFVAIMGTSVHHVASVVFALLLIASLSVLPRWKNIWQQLNATEKLFLMGFGLYAISGMVAYINVQDTREYIKDLERYARFLAAIPIYLYIKYYKVNVINYLYAGAIVSGPFLLFIAIQSYMSNPELPAQGQYHHTIFGSVAMLNVGIMLAMLLRKKLDKISVFIILLAMICGFIAAVLSQSRGVWLALPVYMIIALYYSFKSPRVNLGGLLLVAALITGVIVSSPVSKMVDNRVSAAVEEVSAFYDNNQYTSSLGTRLAMWTIAINEWKKHPLVGSGPGDFDDAIRELQSNGDYKGMDVHISVHNIYFQSLFNAGLIGFLALLFGIIYMPLKVMLRSGSRINDVSLAGIITILLFAIAGISMSWIIRSSAIAVYILFMLTIVSSIYSINNGSEKKEV